MFEYIHRIFSKGAVMRIAKNRGYDALLTDLYQITMMAGYFFNGIHEDLATFELFTRRMPEFRSFMIAAGLEQSIEYLLNLKFTDEEICYLKNHATFKNVSEEFFDYLSSFHFTGDLWAIPEGSLVFPGEPLVTIKAPLIQAQLIETILLANINFQTMVASKAARIVDAANGHSIIDFGTRRAHGPEA